MTEQKESAMKLGDKVRDRYTGFEGIAIARTEWLYGCVRITIQSTKLHDGRPLEDTFDEQRVEVTEAREPYKAAASVADTGGPRDAPRRQRDPGQH